MKKFVYKMQSILDIKKKLEEQEKTNYGIAKAKLNAEEEKLYKMLNQQKIYEEKLRILTSSTLNLLKIKQCQDGMESMKILIKQQRIEIKHAEKTVELALIRLNQIMMERKTQEKLKEQAFDLYKQEFEAEERKEIDELVCFQFGTEEKEIV